MAPVGSYESLMAAIQGGADSIYFGIEGLNMRARSSNNFTTEDLRRIASICQEHGLKSYLTVNTVIYGEDLPLMRTIIDAAKEAGISAIIAASRFGYLGSDISGDGTPAKQAEAYVELLDKLGIDKVYLLATSAGGSIAIRFALDYPERTRGLILYCSAMPLVEKPKKFAEYAGPPAFLCNNYAMFLLSPMFEPIMGMEPSTIYSMMPVNDRKDGVVLDASTTNPDMARNFEDYPIENLQIPTLIFHAKDDKLASYNDTERAVSRFPDCTFVSFENGGHLMEGHGEEIKKAVCDFVMKHD